MNNASLSFNIQKIADYAFQLFSTYSNLSIEIKLTIIGIVVAVLAGIATVIGVIYPIYKDAQDKQKKQISAFNLTWKNSTSITKDDIISLNFRKCDEYYYVRDEDKRVRNCLEQEKNILIVGKPLSGKTRMVYEALRKSKNYNLIIPRATDIDIATFVLPRGLHERKPKLMFIDDLQVFAEKRNFEYVFEECKKNKVNLISTCRSGIEYEKTKKIMLDKNIDLEIGFFDEIIKINEISEEQGKEIAEKANLRWNEIEFNKTVGSIFMRLAAMRERFNECTVEEKSVLRAIKKLFICGVYEEDQVYLQDHIKFICENEGIKKKKYEWEELLENLSKKEFIVIEEERTGTVRAEDVYFEDIVKLNDNELQTFEKMLSIFVKTPEILSRIGKKAYEVGYVILDKAKYMNMAIQIYQTALKITNVEKSPTDYARICNDIGNAYCELADVEDKALNCKKAMEAYKNALKIYTIEKLPQDYARICNDIGKTYVEMADVEDKALNCKKAIEMHKNALKITTEEQLPIEYAKTQYDLGNAYWVLAEAEDKALNCKMAIEAFQNSLKITTEEQLPIDYAMAQNNLGNAYLILADVEDKAQNFKKAIEAYKNALKIRTIEKLPLDYASTKNNIAAAYIRLAEAEDKAINCKKGIEAYQNALKIRTIEKLPQGYANTQNNLGIAYCILADVEDKAINCKKAIEAHQNALKISTVEKLPHYYADTQNNLGNAYLTLAEADDKAQNCKNAIERYQNALKIYTIEKLPQYYAMTQNNLGNAYYALAEVEDKAINCKNAIEAYQNALKIYTIEKLPQYYAQTQYNSGTAYDLLSDVEDKAINCKKAIEAIKSALKIYTEQSPIDYAMIQKEIGDAYWRLGYVYWNLAKVEAKAQNCNKSIEAYQDALKIYTVEQFPKEHAIIQSNIEYTKSLLSSTH